MGKEVGKREREEGREKEEKAGLLWESSVYCLLGIGTAISAVINPTSNEHNITPHVSQATLVMV